MSRSVASAMYRRGMQKGDVVLYMTTDVTRIFCFTLGVWRNGGIMYSSYPEDTPDTLLTRIQDAHVKWILCDPCSIAHAKEAADQAEWPVEIIVFVKEGQVEKEDDETLLDGTTNVDEIFADNGSGTKRAAKSIVNQHLIVSRIIQLL